MIRTVIAAVFSGMLFVGCSFSQTLGAMPAFNVMNYGALCNGTFVDTAGIASAISAAGVNGGTVAYPAGTCLTGNQLINSKTYHKGAGVGATTIQLLPAQNTDLFSGSVNGYGAVLVNAYSASNSGNATAVTAAGFEDLTLDGNSTNQTATSWPIRAYWYDVRLINVTVRNGFSGCIYSDYNNASPTDRSQWLAQTVNLVVQDCGYYNGVVVNTSAAPGILWGGPHDAQMTNTQAFHTTGPAGYFGRNAAAPLLTNCHFWAPITGKNMPALLVEAGYAQFSDCEAEGSDTTQVAALAGGFIWNGNAFASPAGPAYGIQLGQQAVGTAYAWSAFQTPTPGSASPGTATAAGNNLSFIHTVCLATQSGCISYANENKNYLVYSTSEASGVYYAGTPSNTDEIHQVGFGLTPSGGSQTLGSWSQMPCYGNAGAGWLNPAGTNLMNLNCGTTPVFSLPNATQLRLYSDNFTTLNYNLSGTALCWGVAPCMRVPFGNMFNFSGALAMDEYPTVQSIMMGSTILFLSGGTSEYTVIPVTTTAAVMGVIVAGGVRQGQQIQIINTSANNITLSSTNLGSGVSTALNAMTSIKLVWDSGTSAWY